MATGILKNLGNSVDISAETWFTRDMAETTTTNQGESPRKEAIMADFSTTPHHGLLPAGTETPEGVIVGRSFTAYEMADGRYVPFCTIHGPYQATTPLVIFE